MAREGAQSTPGGTMPPTAPRIRVGIGGWNYAPWRGTFFPPGLPHRLELAHASRQLTAIEVNATYYRTLQPATFASWREQTPPGFVFSLKASRFATNRKVLATAAEPIARFVGSGIAELGDKLGPLLWQFMPTKRFDPGDFEAFLQLLPQRVGERPLRHVLDVRHESFACQAYLDLARRYRCTTVYTDAPQFPAIPDAASELAYLRLMRSSADCPTGYRPDAIAAWAQGARAWTAMGPQREVFVYFINGAKERAPAAAAELIRALA
ncbi:DUF72 domain-containing protein [Ramlibacter sp.]|uniref:DUF72 domain-containing protein n=1 Tax=Ramlibacter sp. TaxID=1917967 RepID=UPI002C4980E6|nr:DUF72 domain-containing protein [Ramlibacter sp.]HWI80485.1 DUF72 domain-containing protein [Ramlibacter sp.]